MTATATTAPEVSPEQRARAMRAVVASSVGNVLEWFDIIVYASFAVVISNLFFPPRTASQDCC
jgi:MHS family proline/betaine transporter-like MFS transporter